MSGSWRRSCSGRIGPNKLSRIATTESLSCTQDTTDFNHSTHGAIGRSGIPIHRLHTTQKQTNLTNSLLWDIAVFNEHDSTKLEEWLMDIETAADLTCER